MLGVRVAISIFVLVLLTVIVIGMKWTAAHQSPAQATASALVLGIAGLSGLVALFMIWRRDPPRHGVGESEERRPLGSRRSA